MLIGTLGFLSRVPVESRSARKKHRRTRRRIVGSLAARQEVTWQENRHEASRDSARAKETAKEVLTEDQDVIRYNSIVRAVLKFLVPLGLQNCSSLVKIIIFHQYLIKQGYLLAPLLFHIALETAGRQSKVPHKGNSISESIRPVGIRKRHIPICKNQREMK